MSQYTFEAMTEPKIIESNLGFTDNHDGTFTVTATQRYPHKNDRTIEMRFTHNGLAAITGTLRFLIGEDGEGNGTTNSQD